MIPSKVPVWDAPVRLLHWGQAGVLAAAWWTGSIIGPWHEILGYVAAALLAARVAWGFADTGHARFASFVRAPEATIRYLRAVVAGNAPRHLGHNPLGGWMIVWLLSCVAALTVTGWLATTDWLWGYAWLVNLHALLAWILVVSVVLHIAGAVVASLQHHENLVAAMFSGKKRPPQGDDIG